MKSTSSSTATEDPEINYAHIISMPPDDDDDDDDDGSFS